MNAALGEVSGGKGMSRGYIAGEFWGGDFRPHVLYPPYFNHFRWPPRLTWYAALGGITSRKSLTRLRN